MSLKKHIPNLITSMNIVCGVIGVIFAFKGNFGYSFCLMLLAALFDFCDGFSARALGAYSDMGRELDSLCDLVSFGVLPSVMLYKLMCVCSFGETWFCWIPLVIAVFSALRLAKFNVDERQHENFLGLPTPACAILCGSLCLYVANYPATFLADWCAGPVFIPVLSVVLSALLVCEIPMFSMKFKLKGGLDVTGWKRIIFVALTVVLAVLALVLHLHWSFVPMMAFTLYIVKNVIYWAFKI